MHAYNLVTAKENFVNDASKWKLCAAGFAFVCVTAASGMTVTLNPSVLSPAPVGTMVTFAATTDASGASLWYRFQIRETQGPARIVRDYGPVSSLDWTAAEHEGAYVVEVSVRNLDTGETSSASSSFDFQSRVTDGQPVVTPTANSLVFLYSAPPCGAHSRMRVQFQAAGATPQNTPYQSCSHGRSTNFYLAGLIPDTTYTAHRVIDNGSAFVAGPDVTFTTGDLPNGLYTDTVLVPDPGAASDPILLGSPLGGCPQANDLAGNVVWYGPAGMIMTRAESGGEFWGIVESSGTSADRSRQTVRKFDLTGMTLLETNAARVNEQLQAMGKRSITGFHHEARTISGRRIAVLAAVEQVLSDAQGPGPVDILGDMIIVLDSNLQVVWTWDTFDNLDVHRMATLGEVCPNSGCPAFYLAANANDWTHGNALQETADGNLLYSTRNQDWLIKVSYDGGKGDGHIIWRLGKDGDFQINSADPYPWFSHQHDGNFETADPTRLLVFDNGNVRVAAMGAGNSRGQVLQLDEAKRVANVVLNANLGVYSIAVGSAQQLPDGNYHFDAGYVQESNTADSYSFEIDANGLAQYGALQNVVLYRTFRMADMYTAQ